MLVRFHWLETAVGWLLMAGIGAGLVTLWLAPIAVSLGFAVLISHWSSKPLASNSALSSIMETQERCAPSKIITACYA